MATRFPSFAVPAAAAGGSVLVDEGGWYPKYSADEETHPAAWARAKRVAQSLRDRVRAQGEATRTVGVVCHFDIIHLLLNGAVRACGCQPGCC